MPSLIGFVALAGIVVNNGILLLQSTKRMIQAGTEVKTALICASRDRFRPIVFDHFDDHCRSFTDSDRN